MLNFAFLTTKPDYTLFAPACVEAEKIYASAPALCAVGCRKAMEPPPVKRRTGWGPPG